MNEHAPEGHPGRLAGEEDHIRLTRLLTELAWLIDHGRAEAVHDLFVEDGRMRLGSATVLRGREEIKEWGRRRPAVRTRHVHTNQRFTEAGDGTVAGTSTLTVYMDGGEEPGITVASMVGDETDLFVRTDDGWRFVSRETDIVFGRPARA